MFVTWLCYCGNLGYFLVDAEHFLDFSAVSKVLLLYSFFAGGQGGPCMFLTIGFVYLLSYYIFVGIHITCITKVV